LTDEFVPVMPLGDLQEGYVSPAYVNGVYIALYVIDGVAYCTDDVCTHEDNLLSEGGYVEGDEVECSYHGARFNVKTGEVTQQPARFALRTYPTEVREGLVYVAVS
jgi:p-cumate 2,3-dioxygenase ferredoxin subunit